MRYLDDCMNGMAEKKHVKASSVKHIRTRVYTLPMCGGMVIYYKRDTTGSTFAHNAYSKRARSDIVLGIDFI